MITRYRNKQSLRISGQPQQRNSITPEIPSSQSNSKLSLDPKTKIAFLQTYRKNIKYSEKKFADLVNDHAYTSLGMPITLISKPRNVNPEDMVAEDDIKYYEREKSLATLRKIV